MRRADADFSSISVLMLHVYSPSSALFTLVMTRLDSTKEILWIHSQYNLVQLLFAR